MPPVPQLKDFDVELAAYKEHVKEEIAQEAADAGMTVEEYAANGYEPYTAPEPEAAQTTEPQEPGEPEAQEKPQEPESPVSEKADMPEQAEPTTSGSGADFHPGADGNNGYILPDQRERRPPRKGSNQLFRLQARKRNGRIPPLCRRSRRDCRKAEKAR